MNGASFAKRVVVEVEAEGLSVVDTRFEGGVELRVRRAGVSLRRTYFGAPSSVSGVSTSFRFVAGTSAEAVQERVSAAEAATDGTEVVSASDDLRPAGLEAWVPRLLSVQQTDVSQLTLADVDLRWCRFAGAHHLDELSLEGRSPFNQPPGWQVGRAWPPVWRWTARRVLAEEHPWHAGRRKSGGWTKELPGLDSVAQVPSVGPERLAVLYRSLCSGTWTGSRTSVRQGRRPRPVGWCVMRASHAAAAAISIVMGSLVGAGVNLSTGRPTPAIVVGTVVLVVCWAGLEAWRAARPTAKPESTGAVTVEQDAGHVDGKLTGYRGGPAGGAVEVRQKIERAGSGSEIIGYDGDAGL